MNESLKKLNEMLGKSTAAGVIDADIRRRIERSIVPHHLQDLRPIQVPTARETNAYQSAGILVKRLAETVSKWNAELPADQEPIVLALLSNGVQIRVRALSEESFHGLRIEGWIDGAPCMLLAHQASVQLLCYSAPLEAETPRRPIGFYTNE